MPKARRDVMVSNVNGSGFAVTQAELDQHNIQGAIELVYAQTANSVLSSAMTSLSNALQVTNTVMQTLTGLQTLHNDISVPGKGTFNFNYNSGTYSSYVSKASAFFNKPVLPVITLPSGTTSANFVSQLVTYQNQIVQEITQLSAITPPLAGGGVDPNSLLASLKTVLTDLNSKGVASGNFNAAKSWVLDGYASTAGTTGGQIQQDLTNAVTAGQSLNSTQTQSVREYLYLFEEYYKSATAIAQQLTQLISKMAQNISH
jgi:hypothetical protein